MRPLTDHCPKPLLPVRGKPLLKWHLDALERGGFEDIVVNTAWLDSQIESYFGDRVHYSHEGRIFGHALETAGGVVRALPLLGDMFWVIAGDVFIPDFVFSMDAVHRFSSSKYLAHLWLVPNPEHNPRGDFGWEPLSGLALNSPIGIAATRFTYSTIGLFRRALFEAPWTDIPAGNPKGSKAALAPLLRAAMDQALVSAEIYTGRWTDVGTPQRLAQLNA